MNETNSTALPSKSAWKIALGAGGALAGVLAIAVLLVILVKFALVRPTVLGALTDQERYDLLSKHRADDQKLLGTYGWVDQSKGIVRLPIDVAMQELLKERAAPKK